MMPKVKVKSNSNEDNQQRLDESELSNTALRRERKKQSKARREKEAILEIEKVNLHSAGRGRIASLEESVQAPIADIEKVGVQHTLSIAVPGSIIDNAQSGVLKTYLAGQIGRAAAIFKVSEIIVYDDSAGKSMPACKQLARILQYLECPQYLRKFIFPIHDDLQYIGVVPPLDIPHHLRQHEILPFREGAVTRFNLESGKSGSFVNVGLAKDVKVDKVLKCGTRVTIELDTDDISRGKGKLRGQLVSPSKPRETTGIYWGYSVRIASSLRDVFSHNPFNEGPYDVRIGTSEKGTPVQELKLKKKHKHYLIVFGGVEGLEYALENDETLVEDDVSSLFDHYLNTCLSQGSRTIRTEEAILISMTAINEHLLRIFQ